MQRRCLAAAMCAALAAMPAAAELWCLAANESSATTYSAMTNAYSWVKNDSTSVHSGVEGAPLSPLEDYLVRSGSTMVTPAVSTAFKGKSMTLGTATAEGRIRHRAGGTEVIDWDDGSDTPKLIVHNGFYISYYNVPSLPPASEVHGKVLVTSPEERPFVFGLTYTGASFDWHGDFTGEAGTGFSVEGVNYASSTRPRPLLNNTAFSLHGSLSGYFGKLTVSNTTFTVGSVTVPGTLELGKGAVLTTFAADDVVTAGTLTLGPGAVLSFNADALTNMVLTVTNALNVGGLVTVRMAAVFASTAAQVRPLLRVPAGVDLPASLFHVELSDAESFARTHLAVVNDAEAGQKVLVAVIDEAKPVVTQIITDANVRDTGANGVPYASSMTNDAAWSDGHVPRAGRHYVVQKIGSTATLLRTETIPELDWTFPGESLTIDSGCWLGQFHKSVTFSDFIMLNGSVFQLGVGVGKGAIKGRMDLPSGLVRILTYNGATLTVEADMHGTARIVMDGTHASSSGRSANTEFTGDNSDFFGTMTVSLHLDPVYVNKSGRAATNSQTLLVADAATLGAPLPQFDATALVLKRNSTLRAKGSVTFSDATRGIYVGEDGTGQVTYQTATSPLNSYARFHVDAGETMALRTQLTLNGQLHKKGAGTLALGGTLRFGPAATVGDEPVAGANLLCVDDGFVKPLAADAFNGMEMTFAAGTGIRLDIDPADADLRGHGLRNVKAATPFAAAADGTIPVTFDVPAGFDGGGRFTVAVATAPAEAVALLSVVDPHVPGYRMETAVETADGVATLRATFHSRGCRLIFR